MSDTVEVHRAQHESILAIMQALEDYQNTRMKIMQAQHAARQNIILHINSDISVELDVRGNIVKTVIYYAETKQPGNMVKHLAVLRSTVEKAERAVAQKLEGRLKPWQPSA